MKIQIFRDGADISVKKDFSDVEERGEITQFIIELELLKLELLKLYKEFDDD